MSGTHAPHHHDHAHAHGGIPRSERRLLIAFVLTACMLVAEAIGGVLSGSLALLADAGHMLVDALALLFAWLGARFARRPPDALRSFGYARLEVLVAYTNAMSQLVLVAWIVFEAVTRLFSPGEILSGLMLAVALAGLVINAIVLAVLHGSEGHDLNTAGARLHVLGDLLGSIGAVAAALAIRWFGWQWADPAISVLVSLLILRSAWSLLRRSAHILLEGTPPGIAEDDIRQAIVDAGVDVIDVHHVHVWQLAGGRSVATLHARLREGTVADEVIAQIRQLLRDRFAIAHATIQAEVACCEAAGPCGAPAHGH